MAVRFARSGAVGFVAVAFVVLSGIVLLSVSLRWSKLDVMTPPPPPTTTTTSSENDDLSSGSAHDRSSLRSNPALTHLSAHTEEERVRLVRCQAQNHAFLPTGRGALVGPYVLNRSRELSVTLEAASGGPCTFSRCVDEFEMASKIAAPFDAHQCDEILGEKFVEKARSSMKLNSCRLETSAKVEAIQNTKSFNFIHHPRHTFLNADRKYMNLVRVIETRPMSPADKTRGVVQCAEQRLKNNQQRVYYNHIQSTINEEVMGVGQECTAEEWEQARRKDENDKVVGEVWYPEGDSSNAFHRFAKVFSILMSVKIAGFEPSQLRLVLLKSKLPRNTEEHPVGRVLDALFAQVVFRTDDKELAHGSRQLRRVGRDSIVFDVEKRCTQTVIQPYLETESLLWVYFGYPSVCASSVLKAWFDQVAAKLRLDEKLAAEKKDSKKFAECIVVRRNAKMVPSSDSLAGMRKSTGIERRIENEDELIDALSCYLKIPCRGIDLTEMSSSDQLLAFRAARFVFGMHGAGLIHVAFSRSAMAPDPHNSQVPFNTTFVEISFRGFNNRGDTCEVIGPQLPMHERTALDTKLRGGHVPTAFPSIARWAGVHPHQYVIDSAGGGRSGLVKRGGHRTSVVMDIEHFLNYLDFRGIRHRA